MKYDFDQELDRTHENSYKWDIKPGELPMWVADMDFAVAPEIRKAMEERLSHPTYGYTKVPEDWASAYRDFFFDLYGWKIPQEAILFSSGVIPTISTSVRAFSKPGDEIVILSPVYNIFNHSIENNGRVVSASPLLNDEERYSIDWDDLKRRFSSPKCSMMILCNPHNPIGRIWSKEELAKIAELANQYHVLVVSDEVHGPLTKPGLNYVPYASVSPLAANHSIIALAPTKSFNVAGVQTSAAIANNPEIRKKLEFALNADEVEEGNFLSYLVSTAAWRDSREWLKQEREYVSKSIEYVQSYLRENLPMIRFANTEATYLLWLDISSYDKDDVHFCDELRKETGLWVTPGSTYGPEGKGHIRVNVATPKSNVIDGMERLSHYCQSLESLN